MKRLQAQVWESERLLGKKTLENEILKEALELARPKKAHFAAWPVAQGRYPVTVVAEFLRVSGATSPSECGPQPLGHQEAAWP